MKTQHIQIYGTLGKQCGKVQLKAKPNHVREEEDCNSNVRFYPKNLEKMSPKQAERRKEEK